jgi:ADP-heptose:LPS heptosyltransferase
MAKILFVNLLGIGNCILSTPTVSALHSMGHSVDVLVCRQKCSAIAFIGWSIVNKLYYDSIPQDAASRNHELALWAHPVFPGHRHIPCPLRSVNPSPGSALPYHWRFSRHEVLEVLGLARVVGYAGPVPSLRQPYWEEVPVSGLQRIAIGIGHAKLDIWREKHWGNEEFILLCRHLVAAGFSPVLLGDDQDQRENGWIIEKGAQVVSLCGKLPIARIMGELRKCVGFIGNDTGLMHASAAYGVPTVGIFRSTDPRKNRPWGPNCAYVPADLPPAKVVRCLFDVMEGRTTSFS